MQAFILARVQLFYSEACWLVSLFVISSVLPALMFSLVEKLQIAVEDCGFRAVSVSCICLLLTSAFESH